MLVKGAALCTMLIALSGCASYVAKEITKAHASSITGNLSDIGAETITICDDNNYCIDVVGLKNVDVTETALKFDIKINDNHKIWRYSASLNSENQEKPLEDHLILLFAGYSQPTQILLIHQLWLHQMTGANVIVIPSAEKSGRFQFGLDYISPIVEKIKQTRPEKVHAIGFSMGALAAHALEREIDNIRLYLFAPMTDFEYSTKAIYEMHYNNAFYRALVSEETLKEAIELIYKRSGTTSVDTALPIKLQTVNSPTFIYASRADKVVDFTTLNEVKNEHLALNIYENLNHIEMMALMSRTILADFVSDLLEYSVAIDDVGTIGLLCDFEDKDCLEQTKD
ncbi:lysophospholipase [Glaciecola sp. KUL10]|uniref:lysophospholipase n=1 Tax=Glaciecola sp. (strain KUL10) TaxID=2161813 RepID=UPI0011B49243|nr:lysophospholipase [Glaciecola sp. KUL10]